MVEQLLQLLVGVVDAQLFEAVQIEDLEASNVKDTNEACSLALGSVQASVDPRHDPLEEALVGGLGDGLNGKLHLLFCLGLGHIVPANLDSGLQEGLGQVRHLDSQQVSNLRKIDVHIDRFCAGYSAYCTVLPFEQLYCQGVLLGLNFSPV